MIAGNKICWDRWRQVEHSGESMIVLFIPDKRELQQCLVGMNHTHSSSDMAKRPPSIMSPKNITASGFFRKAARQFFLRFRSTKRLVRYVNKGPRSGYDR